MNPLRELQKYGQSVWLDYIRRSLITTGELQQLIDVDGLRGVTSNPTIFQKAIAGSQDYDTIILDAVTKDPHIEANTLFEMLAIEDIQLAADILRPIYDETSGVDGFVSFELSPHLAYDTEGSLKEAHRLWNLINHPNVMLKVPATPEGIPVIETLIAECINVNVTLMFSLEHYEAVADAYLRGLERCPTPDKVASVASFFLSRIDRVVDQQLDEISAPEAPSLKGKIAIANAKTAYKRFTEKFSGTRWKALVGRGAHVQRVLWASTSTKNPDYSDVIYVEEIIGPDTVNTLPPTTLNKFRDHGQALSSLESGIEEAEAALKQLREIGIDLNAITTQLQRDGVTAFLNSYEKVLNTVSEKQTVILKKEVDDRVINLGVYQSAVNKRLKDWKDGDFLRRLWNKDPTLWFPHPVPEITDRLGWLDLPELSHNTLTEYTAFAQEIKAEGTQHVVLLGMGGSSLAPEMYQQIFGNAPDFPELIVLDSVHPSAVLQVENTIDLTKTLFIVASKSGTTTETLSLFRYFWHRIGETDGNRGQHFIAITDPNTPLVDLAKKRGFRRVFNAPPDIGGRYSALATFGLVPAALIGLDIHQFLDRAWIMSENCAFCVPSEEASGLVLGAALGELALQGRDKITFFTSSSIQSLPVWIEQLIAESTGKNGTGIIPIVNEPVSASIDYGNDRVFVYLQTETDRSQYDETSNILEKMGYPIIRVTLKDPLNVSQEIFYWEIAVAAAGAVLGIHPFNQPNVQMAKDLAREMMEKTQKGTIIDSSVQTVGMDEPQIVQEALKQWMAQVRDNDYIGIQAYIAPTPEITEILQAMRSAFVSQLKVATTSGYGPRFLHSTGQLHKGGPNSGLFLQFIDESPQDIQVPETTFTFGKLIQAQALGDYQALSQLGRRIIRINLKTDVRGNLLSLIKMIKKFNRNEE
ncbi:MAG: bifunctional transaldolase/phosoglucose isomerase [Candidatus Bathyarchaeota archaeon]|nr:bifunctional transaldolase/phosoglucose isomerase [Candidatus Bathyarchaeota archaeon]